AGLALPAAPAAPALSAPPLAPPPLKTPPLALPASGAPAFPVPLAPADWPAMPPAPGAPAAPATEPWPPAPPVTTTLSFMVVATTRAERAVLPAASQARAETAWLPLTKPALLNCALYGLVELVATTPPSTKNCTSTTPVPPALSLAFAATMALPVSIAP